jgi:hypothetical protein
MIKKAAASLVLVMAFCAATTVPAHAAASPATFVAADCGASAGVASFLGLKSWDTCLQHDGNGTPKITKLSDVWLIILPLLEDAIKVAGYAAAGFVIWGGIKYMKSQGDPGQFNEARQVIYNALFGLLLAMISVAIVNFIAGAL